MSTELTDPEKLAYYRILRLAEVVELTGLSRATIYRLMGEGGFPSSVEIGQVAIGWYAGEVLEWLATRPRREKGSSGASNPGSHGGGGNLEAPV